MRPLTRRKALSPGDLVKDGFFTLFEALPALEVGSRPIFGGERLLNDTLLDYGSQDGQRLHSS